MESVKNDEGQRSLLIRTLELEPSTHTGGPTVVLRRRLCECEEMPLPVEGFSHVRLTVTDIAQSREFYESVCGWDVAYEVPDDADDQTRQQLGFLFGGVIYSFGGGLFGLRPVAPSSDELSEDRVGLDHVPFSVASMDAVEVSRSHARRARHRARGHQGPRQMAILEFRDPDGVALDLTAATS